MVIKLIKLSSTVILLILATSVLISLYPYNFAANPRLDNGRMRDAGISGRYHVASINRITRTFDNKNTPVRVLQLGTDNVWIINKTVLIENQELVVNSSIIITVNGTLILRNSTLSLNVTTNGEYNITIQNGGNLTAINSTIRSYDGSTKFGIFATNNSFVALICSKVQNVGFSLDTPGILIDNSTLEFVGSEITSSYIGLYLNNTKSITIRSGYLSCSYAGIYMSNVSEIHILDTELYVTTSTSGIVISNSSGITIRNSTFQNKGSSGIDIGYSKSIVIDQCAFTGSGFSKHIYVHDSSNINITTNEFTVKGTATHYAIYISMSDSVLILNNSFLLYIKFESSISSDKSIKHYGIYIIDSFNIVIASNNAHTYAYLSVNAFFYDFYLTQILYYLSSSSRINLSDNFFKSYVRFSATVSPTFTPIVRYNFYAIKADGLNDSVISYNSYAYNSSYFGVNVKYTYRYFHMSSSRNITVVGERYLNASTKYMSNSQLYLCSDIIIEDLVAREIGFRIRSSDDTVLTNFAITKAQKAVYVDGSQNVTIISGTIMDVDDAIYISSSDMTRICNVSISDSEYALHIKSSNSTIIENVAITTSDFLIEDPQSYNETIIKDSTYKGAPIVILNSSSNIYFSGGSFGAILIGFSGGKIENFETKYLQVYKCENLTIANIRVDESMHGIRVLYSFNITIKDTTISSAYKGLEVVSSYEILICNVNFKNDYVGISLFDVNRTSIINIYVEDSYYSVLLNQTMSHVLVESSEIRSCGYGIYIVNGGNISIVGNEILDCSAGVEIESVMADSIIMIRNNLLNRNDIGVYIGYDLTSYIEICYNNITDNKNALVVHSSGVYVYGNLFVSNAFSNKMMIDSRLDCSFNNSYFGNYWSCINNIDVNKDGIVDEPYNIIGSYYDYLPIAFVPTIILNDTLLSILANNTCTNTGQWMAVYKGNNATVTFYMNTTIITSSDGYIHIAHIDVMTVIEGTYIVRIEIGDIYDVKIILTVDITDPQIAFSVQNGSLINGESVLTVYVTDNLLQTRTVVYINGEVIGVYNVSTITIAAYDLPEGLCNITVIASDEAENKAISSIIVTIDKGKPILLAELENYTYINSSQIVLNITDNRMLAKLMVFINNTELVNISLATNESSYILDLSELEDSIYELTVEIVDEAGNRNTYKYIIKLDRTPPSIATIEYPQNVTVDEQYAVINIEVIDNFEVDSVILDVKYESTQKLVTAFKRDINIYVAVIDILDSGEITFKVIVIDKAHNRFVSNEYTIRVLETTTIAPPPQVEWPTYVLVAVTVVLTLALAYVLARQKRTMIAKEA